MLGVNSRYNIPCNSKFPQKNCRLWNDRIHITIKLLQTLHTYTTYITHATGNDCISNAADIRYTCMFIYLTGYH